MANGSDDAQAEVVPHQLEEEGGPFTREREFLEERLALLGPKAMPAAATPFPPVPAFAPDEAPIVTAGERPIAPAYRQNLVDAYRTRQRQLLMPALLATPEAEEPQAPQPPPANNWIPIGPSALRRGQGGVQPVTSGRTVSIAVAPGGTRVYVGAANGGVWRSDDTGQTWRSLMEAFDLNPTHLAADSLACGAIAIVPGSPDRIYVGTGEGPGGAYFGVGPIVSTDGGQNWVTEPVAPGSPELAGSAFYALAVDPADPERVVAGTLVGLYRREPTGGGGFHWARKTLGEPVRVPSVVVTRQGGVSTFYAAPWFGPVYSSSDGQTWTVVGTGFPSANVGRIGLGVQPDNPDVVYALVAGDDGGMRGVWRLDAADAIWRQVSGHPGGLFGTGTNLQGSYDLAIAVDPNDVNRIYLGGSTEQSAGEWSGSLYRSVVNSSGTGAGLTYSMANAYIGGSVHADIHAIVFAPGDSNKLWVGCDGGVYYTTNPTGSGDIFQSRNAGLSTLTMNFLAEHPTEDAVVFCGTQDNGGARFTGEEVWLHSVWGDSGHFVLHWDDPYKVLSTYVRNSVNRATDGGTRYNYSGVGVPLDDGERVRFYAPLAGTPPHPGSPGEADLVAFGSVRPWISTTFGGNWASIPNGTLAGDGLVERIRSLTFASATKLYAGTLQDRVTRDSGVYRFDKSGASWSRTRLDTMGGANALPLNGPVTDIAVDPADASGDSLYITFGGVGDYRHVWHFDGSQWEQRSGPAAGDLTSLLDVQANAIVVDPANPSHLYAGADLGVWHSADGGASWMAFSEGLPDAAVVDLTLHTERKLLRAATHGRGVYERTLPDAPKQGVELYVRDTQLDQGRFPTVNGLPDPTRQGETVRHWRGPDIKLDTPDTTGQYQFPAGPIDFVQFVDSLIDDFRNVATHATATITTHVYVQVHNRGVTPADDVRVMLLLANAAAGLPALPADLAANVQSGTAITTPQWKTIGFATLADVRVGSPKIASFDLTSDTLPLPANLGGNDHHCVLALIHHQDDPFTAAETDPNTLSRTVRKAALKNLKVVQFIGTPPTAPPLVVPIRLNNARLDEEWLTSLTLDRGRFRGRVRLFLPPLETDGAIDELLDGLAVDDDGDDFTDWAERQIELIRQNQESDHPYNQDWAEQQIKDIERALGAGFMLAASDDERRVGLRRIRMQPDSYHTIFLMLDRPQQAAPGNSFDVQVLQSDVQSETVIGGLDLRVEVVPEPD